MKKVSKIPVSSDTVYTAVGLKQHGVCLSSPFQTQPVMFSIETGWRYDSKY